MYQYQPDPYEPVDLARRRKLQEQLYAQQQQEDQQQQFPNPDTPQGRMFLEQLLEMGRRQSMESSSGSSQSSGISSSLISLFGGR